MKTHTLRFRAVDRDIFLAIKNGVKRIETRAATPRYRAIRARDEVELVCEGERLVKSVVAVELFNSIEELMKEYTPHDINPRCRTVEELTEMFMGFPHYEEKLTKHGLIALRLK